MKKCPTCEKTFEDSMRFCQTDGTPLVDDAPAFDPYATIVGSVASMAPPAEEPASEELAADAPPVEEEVSAIAAEPEAAPEPEPAEAESADTPAEEDPSIHYTVGSVPIAPPEDVLDLPTNDPLKTMYVSDTEMEAALNPTSDEDDSDVMEIPPMEETPAPAPPSFIAPEVPAEGSPPPSPFSAPEAPAVEASTDFDEAATMIQSSPTFDPPAPEPAAPETSPFDSPPPAPSAFDMPQSAPVEQWTPPPAPDAAWENQEIGQNTPFQPPAAGVEGQSKTLAIVSLILGILGLLCCSSTFIVGLAAIITGFMARGKANSDPANFGGSGMAIAGIILGVLSLLIGAVYWVLIVTGTIALPQF